MPAFVLGNAIAAVLMRHTRSAMLQVLYADYVRTARAKGLDERTVVLKHALRNALTPIITLGALEFGTLLSGAVLTEQVFTIPGFGKLIVDAVFNRDYAVVQGVVLFTVDGLHRAEPAGGPGVFPGQPAAEGLSMTPRPESPSWPVVHAHAAPRRRQRAWRRLLRRRGAMLGPGASCSSSSCWRSSRRTSRPTTRSPPAGARCARRRRPQYWFGTDEIGRDVLSRVIWGARASLLAGLVSVCISMALGVPIGLLAGLRRRLDRRPDLALHRLDAGRAVPDPRDRAGGVPRPRASPTR